MTDAIAGISGGTVIKYKDYICGYEVSVLGDIIGCRLITNPNSSTWSEGVIAVQNNVIKAGIRSHNGAINLTENKIWKIRVYYI